MNNLEKYTKAFTESFGITDSQAQELKYQDIAEWDSVGHMSLIAAIEDVFDIMLDTDDIIDFSSFEIGKTIVGKYNVELK